MGDKEYHFVIEGNQPKSQGGNFDDLKIESHPEFDFETLYRESRTKQAPPNVFILYRIKYLQALKRNGYSLRMSQVSKMASESWKRVDNVTKMRYNDSARKAALLWKRKRVRPSSPTSADNVTELSHIISPNSDDIADETRQYSLDEHQNQAVVQSSSRDLVEPEAVVRNANDALPCGCSRARDLWNSLLNANDALPCGCSRVQDWNILVNILSQLAGRQNEIIDNSLFMAQHLNMIMGGQRQPPPTRNREGSQGQPPPTRNREAGQGQHPPPTRNREGGQ